MHDETSSLLNSYTHIIFQVEKALDVAEKLVRASPDELSHVASDLVRTLVQVRCSELAVEGEEESAEDEAKNIGCTACQMSYRSS